MAKNKEAKPNKKKGSTKSFVKGLAAGAVLGAVAALVHSMENKNEKAQALQKAAERIKNKVAKRAKEMGKLTRAAYLNIVDATVHEFKGLKDVSGDELEDLRDELRDSWSEVEGVLGRKKATVPAKKAPRPTGRQAAKKKAKK